MPAISSLCLVPWRHNAYHRKPAWRHYLVWISRFHCLIIHTIFLSPSVSFCRKNRLGTANWRGITVERLSSCTFQGTVTSSSSSALTSTYLWAQRSWYSEEVWCREYVFPGLFCWSQDKKFLLIFAVRHDCIHVTLIEHLSMKHIQANKNKNRPTQHKETKYKAQRTILIPVVESQHCITAWH